AQAADLAAGRWYFNIHTAANPPGEIRGQVTK
ncbi:MAG TPA: CHRD domain-containing protein, partial [Reyranella sp.]|nr:CHRD domain-containing protein [Reyranella sp.]